MLEPGELFARRYRIEAIAGEGGMGVVYLAADTVLENEKVALKILHSNLASDERHSRRFLREAQLTRKVSHPNIVRTFEVGDHEGQFYLAMEYVPGRTLKSFLQEGPIPEAAAVPILIDVCQGLSAVHGAGIIHRDLTPGNIILSADGVARIMDFGIARGAASELTSSREVVGSTPYMAPEIWLGKEIDARSDIYSLGIVAFEMLSGLRPFAGDSPAEYMYKHLEVVPEPVGIFVDEVSPWLQQLVAEMLAKEPAARPQNATALARELQNSWTKALVAQSSAAVLGLEPPTELSAAPPAPPAHSHIISQAPGADPPGTTISQAQVPALSPADLQELDFNYMSEESSTPFLQLPLREYLISILYRLPAAAGATILVGALISSGGGWLLRNAMGTYVLPWDRLGPGIVSILALLFYCAILGGLPLLLLTLSLDLKLRILNEWLHAVFYLMLSSLGLLFLGVVLLQVHSWLWFDSHHLLRVLSISMPDLVSAVADFMLRSAWFMPAGSSYLVGIDREGPILAASTTLSWPSLLVFFAMLVVVTLLWSRPVLEALGLGSSVKERLLLVALPLGLLLSLQELLARVLAWFNPRLLEPEFHLMVGSLAFGFSQFSVICSLFNLSILLSTIGLLLPVLLHQRTME